MKKIIIVFVLILTLLLCACNSNVDKPSVPVIEEEEKSDVIVEDYIFSEETEFPVGVSAEIYITAPKVTAPMYGENVDKFNRLIDMSIETVKNEYLHDVSIGEGSEGAAATSRMMTYEVYTAKDGHISVMLKVTVSIAGSVTPTVAYNCINFDLKEGKVISLAEAIGEDKIDAVKSAILEQMKQTPEKYFSVDDDALAGVDISNSFLEDEEKLYIVIGEYTIAPRSAGTQIFEINKGDIA